MFESVEEAEQALEHQLELFPEEEERYKKSALYKIKKMSKEMEGVEVVTEQSGLMDFSPDGGYELPVGYDLDLVELAESAHSLEW